MAIEPSYRSAAAAGLWSAVGLVPFDLWRAKDGSASPVADNLAAARPNIVLVLAAVRRQLPREAFWVLAPIPLAAAVWLIMRR